MNLVFNTCSTVALNQVGWHRNHRAAQLVAKRKSFLIGKFSHKFIHLNDKFASHLPRFKIFKFELIVCHILRILAQRYGNFPSPLLHFPYILAQWATKNPFSLFLYP